MACGRSNNNWVATTTKYMRSQSKKFKKQAALLDAEKLYTPEEAIELAQKISYEKFDASVEVHVKTGVDPKKGEQTVRGTIVLPHGIGKVITIAVFAEGDKAQEARDAGADIVGGQELIQEIKTTGKADFEAAIATPDMMKNLAMVARVLGPKGLMPSPKNETVTNNIKSAIEQLKKGKINFKNDSSSNVHQSIGKKSFTKAQLLENFTAFLDALKKSRPSAAKGAFIRSVTISTTMGPGIHVQIGEA